MNRLDIKQQLTLYTPLEQHFKSICEKSGRPATQSDFLHLLANYENLPDGLKAELNLTGAASSTTDILPFTPQFTDALWFREGEDICVRRHPRYSPAVFHTHSFIEISYVAAGCCHHDFSYPGGQLESLTLPQGSLCILPPGLTHAVSVFDDSSIINILIRTAVMKHTLTNLVAGNHALFDFFLYTLYENTNPNYLLFHTASDETVNNTILDLTAEAFAKQPYSQNMQCLMLGLLFTHLQRSHSQDIKFSSVTASGLAYIPHVLAYIQENYREASAPSIAKQFSVSTSYLARIFKENAGTTVLSAIQQVRMEKACELLVSTALPVQQIAEKVGYADITHFIRMFKKHNNITPLQYRKHGSDSALHSL